MAQSDYNVNINIRTNHSNPDVPPKVKKGLDLVKVAAKALGVVMAAGAAAKYAVDLAKVGAAAQRQATSLDNLAADAGSSGDRIVAAIQGASGFTIDRMGAMAAANKALVMDVAQTPAQFERLTKVATALGRAMGQDATKSIDDFVTASARQSQMIADNLGLTVTVGQATERYAASLGITVDELTDAQKKQAFLNMMLEEGEKKMAALGPQTLDFAGSMEALSAAANDAKTEIGLVVAEMLEATGLIPKFTEAVREATTVIKVVAEANQSYADTFNEYRDGLTKAEERELALARTMEERLAVLERAIPRIEKVRDIQAESNQEVEESALAMETASDAARYQSTRLDSVAYASDAVKDSLGDQVISQGLMLSTILQATDAIDGEAVAMDKFASTIDAAAQLSLSMGFTRQAESEKEAAARIAVDKEKIESEHLENMTAIQAKGASRAVRLDVASEQEKLATREFALTQAQLKVDEMTGKERESAQNAKQQTLTIATQKYAEQQKLLEDYSAGRLVIAGQNTDALIAEEQRRYQEALKIQEAEEAKQAKDQKKAQGEMLIQAVDTWADQEDLPPEMTKKVAEMRVNIAEEYGMVAEGSAALVADILGELDAWASGAKVTTGELVGYFGDVISATDDTQGRLINLTASEYVIKVRYEEIGGVGLVPKVKLPCDPNDPMSECYDPDGGKAMGGSFMVGEAGAEMVTVQPVGRGRDAIYNDTFNIYDGNSMAAVQENRRRQRRGGIARTM